MQYLVDAQLPRRVKAWLIDYGVSALHTLDLPRKNRTSDREIIADYSSSDVVIVSKDKDFPHQRIIHGKPEKLLWITTGNIRNDKLISLFEFNFDYIVEAFNVGAKFIEMDNVSVIIHE